MAPSFDLRVRRLDGERVPNLIFYGLRCRRDCRGLTSGISGADRYGPHGVDEGLKERVRPPSRRLLLLAAIKIPDFEGF